MKMNQPILSGISFGLASGIITTLGLLIGLSAATNNKVIAISGVLTIAIADSLSDALGMHISKESDKNRSNRYIWRATFSTFWAKMIVGLSFLIPLLLLDLTKAIIVSITYGLLLLGIFSYFIAKSRNEPAYKTIFEHITIAIIVIIVTKFIGNLISFYL
jgi:vacuolar iron transporter family protein